MRISQHAFHRETGWQEADFPAWDGPNTLVIAFFAPELADETRALAPLLAAFPRSCVIGCSSAGEIHGSLVRDQSVVAAIVQFEHSGVRSAVAKLEGSDGSLLAARTIARQLDGPDLRAVFVLSDGTNVNGTQLVHGLADHLAPGVAISGGLAGDGDRFRETQVIVDGRARSGFVSAVGLYGDRLRIGHGSGGGWDAFGPERLVTRAQGNILYELDNRPALQLYKEYLGELAQSLPASALLFPLSVRPTLSTERRVVRTILGIDERSNSLRFAGEIPQGGFAQLMRANFDRLVQGASDAAAHTRVERPTGPVLAISISCVGRLLVLRQRVEEETESTLEGLPEGTLQMGFYSYGELSAAGNARCELHNQTMTLTTLEER